MWPRSPSLSLLLVPGAASVAALFFLAARRKCRPSEDARDWPGPLPYPPDALPGARDVDSPYGTTRVYEWGPVDGARVLLVHGISTPSIALAGLARKLVAKGFRVMLFDLWARGYSSAPDPLVYRYSSSLYCSQILICLHSAPVAWDTFTLVGYSLGGAIAADFTSYFPHRINGLVLVASGGLIRPSHITWKSRLLYSTSGLVPEWLIQRIVAKRLWSGPETARSMEPEPETGAESLNENAPKSRPTSQAVYASSRLCLLPGNPASTVSNVVDWQIQHHKGFVPAFISSIRYAPIHSEHDRWRQIARHIANGVGPLKEVKAVLGESDPIIIMDEFVQDANEVLGKENLKIKVEKGAGHEVAMDRADEIADILEEMHR